MQQNITIYTQKMQEKNNCAQIYTHKIEEENNAALHFFEYKINERNKTRFRVRYDVYRITARFELKCVIWLLLFSDSDNPIN